MVVKTKPSKKAAPAAAAPSNDTGAAKKRRRDGKSKTQAVTPAVAPAVAPAVVENEYVSAKKQRLEEVSAIAKDVMLGLLQGDLSYDVTDAEWESLVTRTQSHANFTKHFTFPSETESGWVTPKRKTKSTHLKIVALDCEMCVTAPLNNNIERKSNALCRVSAVNGEDMIRGIVSDLIVHQPEHGYRMVDPKTDIHGVTIEMINASKISVAKAQRHLLKYINADTIIVGHSVHGDLAALRINHTRVIDTAKIFARKDGDAARATPGLKCLTKFLLKFEMPDGHDSTIDSQASMLAAKYAAKHECGAVIPSATELHGPRLEPRRGGSGPVYVGPPKILPSAFQLNLTGTEDATATTASVVALDASSSSRVPMDRPPPQQVLDARSCQLRVHRVPRGVTAQDIQQFFVQTAKVVPGAVESPHWPEKQPHGSANVTFTSNLHAHVAFEAIEAKKTELDAIGRPQKLVALKTVKGKTYKGIKIGVM